MTIQISVLWKRDLKTYRIYLLNPKTHKKQHNTKTIKIYYIPTLNTYSQLPKFNRIFSSLFNPIIIKSHVEQQTSSLESDNSNTHHSDKRIYNAVLQWIANIHLDIQENIRPYPCNATTRRCRPHERNQHYFTIASITNLTIITTDRLTHILMLSSRSSKYQHNPPLHYTTTEQYFTIVYIIQLNYHPTAVQAQAPRNTIPQAYPMHTRVTRNPIHIRTYNVDDQYLPRQPRMTHEVHPTLPYPLYVLQEHLASATIPTSMIEKSIATANPGLLLHKQATNVDSELFPALTPLETSHQSPRIDRQCHQTYFAPGRVADSFLKLSPEQSPPQHLQYLCTFLNMMTERQKEYLTPKSVEFLSQLLYDLRNQNKNSKNNSSILLYDVTPYPFKKYGGGNPTTETICDDTITVSSSESNDIQIMDPWEQWIPFPHNKSLQKQNIIIQDNTIPVWTPDCTLTFQHQTHPLLQVIQQEEIEQLRVICQLARNTTIIRCAHDRRLHLTRKEIQSLVSHGHTTTDHVITLYIKMLSESYNIPYLSTDFIPRLINEGWNSVTRYFANNDRSSRKRKLTRPNKAGEHSMIIPTFINNSHWLAIVRRELNDEILFLYADDMNNSNSETELKNLIRHHTDDIFCPPNAKWIKCKNTYYTPHSNECGPRTLLALHIMAIHPNPDADILTHLMHPNLAQISRVWIATSLITGKLHDMDILNPQLSQHRPFSLLGQSTPLEIIQWKSNNNRFNEQEIFTAPNSQYSDHTLDAPSNLDPTQATEIHIIPTQPVEYHITDITDQSNTHRQASDAPSQMNLTEQNGDKHLLPTSSQQNIMKWTTNRSSHLTEDEELFLQPFGHSILSIDPRTTFRIVMQNPQYALQLTRDNHEISQIATNLTNLQASAFAVISPNINFCNISHALKFKKSFQPAFKQVHLTASSCEFGAQPCYKNIETLTGGTAILSFNQWASKVESTQYDKRGQGSFSITTYNGKNGRKLSLIVAYIAVQKGTNHGETSLYAQQYTMMEFEAKKQKRAPTSSFCPRKAAIKELSNTIASLQEQDHAIILMIDANQTSKECFSSKGIKTHSIEWLRIEHGMDDPFIDHFGRRPLTTTINNNRDIDYVYTWGIQINRITTLAINVPANSDHLGICIDIDIEALFGGKYSELTSNPRRKLTLNNVKAKLKYISYITKEWNKHNYFQRAQTLYAAARDGTFHVTHHAALQILDKQVTSTLIKGEDLCAKDDKQRNPWSPSLCQAGVTLSYWKKKFRMSKNKHFRWHILDSLHQRTTISLQLHRDTDPKVIKLRLRQSRKEWRETKKRGNELRQSFLQEQAEEYARKRNMKPAQALKAIQQAEESKRAYNQIQELIGGKKVKNPLTQIEILDTTKDGAKNILTDKNEIERAIMERNQRHSRQSLNTPFQNIPSLANAINPTNPNNKIEEILAGEFVHTLPDDIPLSPTEKQWIKDLQQKVDMEIDTHISLQEFINFFKRRKEKTASSYSGRHYGHYKVIAQMADEGYTDIADTLIFIINATIATSSPLERWSHSAQVMIEKGKGNYIENLRIIQICEADLNFSLNVLWGDRMIRSALKHEALNDSQFALPGQTCNSAVWNKVLYCDLLRQTLSPGIMTDYDATAAFDRVLHAMSIITCRRFGMPQTACLFIYNLLHSMEFHVVTGLGLSEQSFTNNEDPARPGQGVLQGSSSAAPIYNVNSDVSLTTYNKLASGATFTHPITKVTITDHATQYVDDKTDMLNLKGVNVENIDPNIQQQHETLFDHATKNSNIWAELQWISGGDLNQSKCFSYFIDPYYDYKKETIKYTSKYKAPGTILMKNPVNNSTTTITREEPHTARRTLGVHLAPNGDSSTQTRLCIEKAATFLGKLKHSKMPQKTKWKAINTVMSPGVLYPLMSSTCSKKELDKIEKVMASAKCNALGLNEHFPRALIYGPSCYGGMQLPTTHASATIERINYFLYHIRTSSKIGKKLDISLAFLQLETGLLTPFLSSSYERYGAFATHTLIKCIWAHTEPFGLYLQPDPKNYWLPSLQGTDDIAIMEDIQNFFDSATCIKINRCRLYYQVITLYDLLTYDGTQIHPEYTSGNRPSSRVSVIHWVNFNKPPRNYLKLWNDYLNHYVQPRIPNLNFSWNTKVSPHYNTSYHISTRNGKLYFNTSSNEYRVHEASRNQPGYKNTIFNISFSEMHLDDDFKASLQPVDVTHHNQQISILCKSSINNHGIKNTEPIQNKYSFYRKLPKSLRRICGKISIPPDGGQKLIEYIKDRDGSLMGVSDASITDGEGTHAWILTTGEKEHIDDPYMKIEGCGPVDGDKQAMSSARGELQGQTALAIITETFLNDHDAGTTPVTFYTDNQGVQQCCNNPKIHRIGHHRKANMDLQMEHSIRTKSLTVKHKWVKGHQDKDMEWDTIEELKDLDLDPAATLNIYCDRRASEAHKFSVSISLADVLPAEKWALYSRAPEPHKITGKLTESILQALHTAEILEYIARKHGLTEDKMYHVDTSSLQTYLKALSPHNRASIVKLMHRWIPTNASLFKQNRASSPFCERCHTHKEDAHHILHCPDSDATSERNKALYTFLEEHAHEGTSKTILECLENNLTSLLHVESMNKYCITCQPPDSTLQRAIRDAKQHQTIIGWENLLRGYTSTYWAKVQSFDSTARSSGKKKIPWTIFFLRSIFNLHKTIWNDRNTYIHGKTIQENQQKLRQRVIDKVKAIYKENPTLAKRYPAITNAPLENRIRRSTQALQDWINRVEHQTIMTNYIVANQINQMTILEAFRRVRTSKESVNKYPP
jgi:hypothetical protein